MPCMSLRYLSRYWIACNLRNFQEYRSVKPRLNRLIGIEIGF